MKVDFKPDRLLITPESPVEKESFFKLFPKGQPTGTRRIRVKEFVDQYGQGNGQYYLTVTGNKQQQQEECSDGISG